VDRAAVAVQVVLGVSWGSPAGVFDPERVADAALAGACVAVGALTASALSVRGRDALGVFAWTILVTAASTVLFGTDPDGVNGTLSLAAGYGVFVAMAYTLGWLADGVFRRGVVVNDGAVRFDALR